MDTQQHLKDQEEIEELRLQTSKLKKELEREQHLHSMLHKEWKELNLRMTAKEREVYESSREKNPFYKYAFYALLIAIIPAFYFLYFRTGNEKAFSPVQAVSDSIRTGDSAPAVTVGAVKDSILKNDSIPAGKQQQTQTNNRAVAQQPVIEPEEKKQQPVIKPEEKKATPRDSSKRAVQIVRKPEVETPLTDEIWDSISSDGFNAYFNHRRNPFKKSSERYEAWQEGWNDGKVEAKKLLAKDPSLKLK